MIAPVDQRLRQAADEALGRDWMATWSVGLPPWHATPGEINLPVLLWLYNLLEAWDLESYAKARYGLLGSGGHWFAGANADGFDAEVSAEELQSVFRRARGVSASQRFCAASSSGSRANPRCACRASERSF